MAGAKAEALRMNFRDLMPPRQDERSRPDLMAQLYHRRWSRPSRASAGQRTAARWRCG